LKLGIPVETYVKSKPVCTTREEINLVEKLPQDLKDSIWLSIEDAIWLSGEGPVWGGIRDKLSSWRRAD